VKWNHSRDYRSRLDLKPGGRKPGKLRDYQHPSADREPYGAKGPSLPPKVCYSRARTSCGTQAWRGRGSDSRPYRGVSAGLAQPPFHGNPGLQACNRGRMAGHRRGARHTPSSMGSLLLRVIGEMTAGAQDRAPRWTWAAHRGALTCHRFRRLAAGNAVSNLGDRLGFAAVAWLATELARPAQRPHAVALAVAANSLPGALTGLLARRRWRRSAEESGHAAMRLHTARRTGSSASSSTVIPARSLVRQSRQGDLKLFEPITMSCLSRYATANPNRPQRRRRRPDGRRRRGAARAPRYIPVGGRVADRDPEARRAAGRGGRGVRPCRRRIR